MQTRHHHSPAIPTPRLHLIQTQSSRLSILETWDSLPPHQLPCDLSRSTRRRHTTCEAHHKPSRGRASPLPHPGRQLFATHPQHTNLARGRISPCSSQPSFRSRLCHWPQAGILPHQIQSQEHIAPIRHHCQLPAGHQSHPVPVTDHPTHPHHSAPAPTLNQDQVHLTPPQHTMPVPSTAQVLCLNLIQLQFNPAVTRPLS